MIETSFIVYADNEEQAVAITGQLESVQGVRVVSIATDPIALANDLLIASPTALFLELGEKSDVVLDAYESCPEPRPALILRGEQGDTDLLLRAMRLGAKEFFGTDMTTEDLNTCIDKLRPQTTPTTPPGTKNGVVFAIAGAKGGLGSSTVSCQLASALARHGRVAIVDLELRSGDVSLFFDVKPSYTLADLGDGEKLDITYLRTILETHSCGVRILAAPEEIEDVELVDVHHLEHVITLLQEDFDWIILDVPKGWDEISLRAADLCDQFLLVTDFEVPALRHTRRHLDILGRLGHSKKVRIIANREGDRVSVSAKDIEAFLNRAPDAVIPNDFPSAAASIDRGQPVSTVAPRSKLAKAFKTLAEDVHEWVGQDRPSQPKRNSFDNFLGKMKRR
jgi:pilus assembly protein CpaE